MSTEQFLASLGNGSARQHGGMSGLTGNLGRCPFDERQMTRIAERFRQRIRQARLTLGTIKERFSISRHALTELLAGRRVSIHTLTKLEKALATEGEGDWLLGGMSMLTVHYVPLDAWPDWKHQPGAVKLWEGRDGERWRDWLAAARLRARNTGLPPGYLVVCKNGIQIVSEEKWPGGEQHEATASTSDDHA